MSPRTPHNIESHRIAKCLSQTDGVVFILTFHFFQPSVNLSLDMFYVVSLCLIFKNILSFVCVTILLLLSLILLHVHVYTVLLLLIITFSKRVFGTRSKRTSKDNIRERKLIKSSVEKSSVFRFG